MKKMLMLDGAKTTVSSSYNYKNRTTLIRINTGEKSYVGKAVWNPNDPFNPVIGYEIAYERAYAEYLKDNSNIIEMCGGLRNGDWVCVKASRLDFLPLTWGLVCDNFIYYMMNSKGFDPVSIFKEKGDTGNSKIIKVIRSKSHPVTFGYITHLLADPASNTLEDIEIYEVD
jgi:hypothetical protein